MTPAPEPAPMTDAREQYVRKYANSRLHEEMLTDLDALIHTTTEADKARIAELETANDGFSDAVGRAAILVAAAEAEAVRLRDALGEMAAMHGRITATADLLPCPFCGAAAEHDQLMHSFYVRNKTWRIVCDECFCGTSHFSDEAEAIAAWNRREARDGK